MSRQNTLQNQLIFGISINQERLNNILVFLNAPYGPGAEERWTVAVKTLISFNNDCQSVIFPKIAKSTVIATLPGGNVWYYTDSLNNTYDSFVKREIATNHNQRCAFMQALLSDDGFGYEENPSFSSSLRSNGIESRSVMRLGNDKKNIVGCIGLASIIPDIENDPVEIVIKNSETLNIIFGKIFFENNNLLSSNQGLMVTTNIENIFITLSDANQGVLVSFLRLIDNEFIVIATTIKVGNSYAIGSKLENGIPYQNLINGKSFDGITKILSFEYYGNYTPVFDSNTNNLIGAYFSGIPL
jgi:hypothetical protein